MTVRDLEILFDYGWSANEQLRVPLETLSPEQFTQSVAGGYGSVRNTLVHMLSAEWGWLERSGGPRRGPALRAPDYPALHPVLERWRWVEQEFRRHLSALQDEDLQQILEFSLGDRRYLLRRGEMLHHAAIHGVHHRGQIALLLRVLGIAPGNFDILFYYARPPQALTEVS